MAERIFPNVVLRQNVACSQDRGKTKINVGVLHCTEGGTLRSVLDWFDTPSTQASSNVIVGPDNGGVSAVCMPLRREAWGVTGGWNPHCWHIEQLGFAEYTTKQWHQHQGTLEEAARWMGYVNLVLNLPLVRARVQSFPKPQTFRSGWTEHRWMRDHDDPGVGYPFDAVLNRAVHYRDQQAAYRREHGHLPPLA